MEAGPHSGVRRRIPVGRAGCSVRAFGRWSGGADIALMLVLAR